MISPYAVGVQGIGFSPYLVSVQGFGLVENKRDGGGGGKYRIALRPNRREAMDNAAQRIDALLSGAQLKTDVRQVADAVKAYSGAKTVGVSEVGDTLTRLSVAEYELRQELLQGNRDTREVLLILEEITVLLAHVQDDEEAVLVLLLDQP